MNKKENIEFICEVALPLCYVATVVVLVAAWGQILIDLTTPIN